MKLLILTPIPLEYDEVRKYLKPNPISPAVHKGIQYEEGKFSGRFLDYEVVITKTGSKNTEVALATEKAIQQYHPDIAILTGIAGGVKDVVIGDIVIANKLYGYQSGKATDDGLKVRPEVFHCSMDLVAFAEKIGRNDAWRKRSDNSSESKVYCGPIISGDKVIASVDSPEYRIIKDHFNDTLALEMEASGFGKVLLYHPEVKYINIRGVSDLLKNKSESDKEGGQENAVSNAVAFVFEMLFELQSDTLNRKGAIDIKKVNTYAQPEPSKAWRESSKNQIEDLVEKNKVKPALESMLILSKSDDHIHRRVIMLGNRWNRLNDEKMADMIDRRDYNIELNKILNATLKYLEDL